MLEIALYSTLIIAGSIIYSTLDDKPKEKESIPTKDNSNKETKDIYDNTYNYFMSLSLEEQYKYINDNLDLRYYKDELLYDNKQSTARQVSRRAVKYNKEFTNRHKVY